MQKQTNPKGENYPHRSVFSCNVYKTTEEHRSPLPPFKPISSEQSKNSNEPEILYVNEKILKRRLTKAREIKKDHCTQTSKTIIQLAQLEAGYISPDSLGTSPRSPQNNPYAITNHHLSDYTLDGSCHEQDCVVNKAKDTTFKYPPLTRTFLERNKQKKQAESLKSKSFADNYYHPNYIRDIVAFPIKTSPKKLQRRSSKSLDLPDNSHVRHKSSSICYVPQNTFMFPTKASKIKSKMEEIQSASFLIPPMRRGRSTSPRPSMEKRWIETSKKIPYIDQSKSDVSSSTTIVNTARHPERIRRLNFEDQEDREGSLCSNKFSDDRLSLVANLDPSSSSVDTSICAAVNRFRELDWRTALRGLSEIVELCRVVDVDLIYDYMTSINQRLIELLKSPRSHVCRTACQAAGHLFEYVKDTRRPEFDDIVDLLLHKTADANKFIRQDANLALDCMVTHITSFHAVRSLCHRGPFHKNPLVRSATVRLLVCVVVIAGPDSILNPNNNECTRKRIILSLARFLEDKNLETRKLAERLYKVLCKESRFDVYLKKYLEKEQISKIKKTLKLIHKK